jgi:uncharacterized membrane protein
MGGCAAIPDRNVISPMRVPTVATDLPRIDNQKNLESYYLFWLDSTARSPEYMEIFQNLRSIINFVKIFESTSECQKAVMKVDRGKIFVISHVLQGLILLNAVHDHPQLESIYLYKSQTTNDPILNQYSKVILLRSLA